MQQHNIFQYYEDDELQMVRLPYGDDAMCMISSSRAPVNHSTLSRKWSLRIAPGRHIFGSLLQATANCSSAFLQPIVPSH